MSNSLKAFAKRARSVEKSHRKLASGYVTKLDENGNIKHRPRGRVPFLFNPFTLLPLVAVFLCLKAYLYTQLGAEAYEAHVWELARGGFVDRIGAVLMGADPATRFIADAMAPTV